MLKFSGWFNEIMLTNRVTKTRGDIRGVAAASVMALNRGRFRYDGK